jgi:hypothetical protein
MKGAIKKVETTILRPKPVQTKLPTKETDSAKLARLLAALPDITCIACCNSGMKLIIRFLTLSILVSRMWFIQQNQGDDSRFENI